MKFKNLYSENKQNFFKEFYKKQNIDEEFLKLILTKIFSKKYT